MCSYLFSRYGDPQDQQVRHLAVPERRSSDCGRVITMIGGVTLTQGGNTVNGGRLTITLDTGRAVIDGAAMAGGSTGAAGTTTPSSGRVPGRFSVPARGGDTRDCSANRRNVPRAPWRTGG